MNVTIIHVGDFKEKYLKDAFLEYSKRISAFGKFEDILIKESFVPDAPNDAQVEKVLKEEGEKILEKLDPKSKKVALCVEGKQFSSEDFSQIFTDSAEGGFSKITFIIGSSHGLCDKVKKACDIKLSFSKMTFPHQLMRVILSEQIYRAFTIINGKKYHK